VDGSFRDGDRDGSSGGFGRVGADGSAPSVSADAESFAAVRRSAPACAGFGQRSRERIDGRGPLYAAAVRAPRRLRVPDVERRRSDAPPVSGAERVPDNTAERSSIPVPASGRAPSARDADGSAVRREVDLILASSADRTR
jgi:hypothetical protein